MAVTFDNLNPNAPIFRELKSNAPSWWERFINDPALYIEIRKDNQVNVYFEGGSIARIHYCSKKRKLQVFTHHKYLGHTKSSNGTLYEECSEYIGQIIDEVLDRVKKEYSQKHIANGITDKEKWSEKFIQGSLIVKNRSIHLDSEFAYKDKDSDIRIDLIRCEDGELSFVELKRMDDNRMLHEDDQSPEIVDQMNRYRLFVQNYNEQLLHYYQKVYDLKQSLNLPVPNIRPNEVNSEPQLIIFDRWMKSHPKRDVHRKRVKEILERENIHYTIQSDL